MVATGCRIMPGEVEGMMEGWRGDIQDFYTPDGAVALHKKWKYFKKGRIVLNIAEMPIKCPVAPLEFIFMADWFFTVNGVRKRYRTGTGDPALRAPSPSRWHPRR